MEKGGFIVRSMTGFGAGTASDGKISVTIEMRAVNQRFLELNIRMPHNYLALEDMLRNEIKQVLHRGKVDVFVTVQEVNPEPPQLLVNDATLGAYCHVLEEVKKKYFPTEGVRFSEVTSLSTDWLVQVPPTIDDDACRPVFIESLHHALDGMVAMRCREGENIEKDLLARTDTMTRLIDGIAARRQPILEAYEERLTKRITSVFEKMDKDPDKSRLMQEVAIYADKADFTEEVVRFRSHVLQLKGLLASDGDIGRKLDFLIQEMNRETNTIGSKTQDMEATELVLQLKNEIEKIREQIQNIE